MSLYIKTKTNIVRCKTIADIQTKVIWRDNFVAQANNIKDLLEEYVVETYGKRKFVNEWYVYDNPDLDLEQEDVYGAIQTEDGWKLVAKLNTQKNWELIRRY